MLVAVHVGGENGAEWRDCLQVAMPECSCRLLDDSLPLEKVTHAAVWMAPPGWLATLPQLRCVLSLAAGVDHVLADPALPDHVPVLRLHGEPLAARMREYVLLAVLALHRDLPRLLRERRQRIWIEREPPVASGRRVGVMGLGSLGRDAARTLARVGFSVAGWSRRRREVPEVACYAGESELDEFLRGAEILVNLLPLTDSTRDILDRRRFSLLPRGAGFVNVGRGAHVVEEDLLAALESGQVSGAVLDCFREEPLPSSHPFWGHPRVLMTPHVAAPLAAPTAAEIAADLIRRFEAGETLPGVDRASGY